MNFPMCSVNSIPYLSSHMVHYHHPFPFFSDTRSEEFGSFHLGRVTLFSAGLPQEASHALLAGCIDALMRHAVSLGAGATSEKDL